MAYSLASLENFKQIKGYTDALAEFDSPFDYGEGVSLANLVAANNAVKAKIKARNEALEAFQKIDAELAEMTEKTDNLVVNLRNCIKGVKGEESAEYVAIGGKRRSEITAQAKATRNENKKAETTKKQQNGIS
jgi:hypothetical protein